MFIPPKNQRPVAIWIKVDGKLEMRWIDVFSTVRPVRIVEAISQ